MKKLLGVGAMGAAAGALWLLLRYERALWERADRVPPSASAPDPNQAGRRETEGSG